MWTMMEERFLIWSQKRFTRLSRTRKLIFRKQKLKDFLYGAKRDLRGCQKRKKINRYETQSNLTVAFLLGGLGSFC